MILLSLALCDVRLWNFLSLISLEQSRSISKSVQTIARSRAEMEFQASLFGRTCANILPSPPASPSIYAYPSALGERCWYTTRIASPHVLSTPASTIFNPGGSAPHPGNEMVSASRSEGNPPRERGSPPQSSTLHQITTAEDYNPVSSGDMAPELPPPDQVPDHLRAENPLKQRPTRASSTASQPTPQLVLTEAENQSDGEELATGTDEEEDVAGGTEAPKSGAERLAEKRKLKRFRSARTSPWSNGH